MAVGFLLLRLQYTESQLCVMSTGFYANKRRTDNKFPDHCLVGRQLCSRADDGSLNYIVAAFGQLCMPCPTTVRNARDGAVSIEDTRSAYVDWEGRRRGKDFFTCGSLVVTSADCQSKEFQ